MSPRARLSPQGVQSTWYENCKFGTEEHRRREVHRTVLWLPEWQVHPRASSLFAFLRPLISLIHSRLLSGHIPGGEGLCGCGGAYELAERLNEMRTQFVQWGLQRSLLEAKSPPCGPPGDGTTSSRLSEGSIKVNVVVENGTMGPSMADDTRCAR